MEEIKAVIKKLKNGKAPGPDGVPMEYFKALDEEVLTEILTFMNVWLKKGTIPNELLLAQVVLIFKKKETPQI